MRLISEAEFEDVFRDFKKNRISGQFSKVYEQVLTTVGTAHDKNKKQKLFQDREIKQLQTQSLILERQTTQLNEEKQKAVEELNKRRNTIA